MGGGGDDAGCRVMQGEVMCGRMVRGTIGWGRVGEGGFRPADDAPPVHRLGVERLALLAAELGDA